MKGRSITANKEVEIPRINKHNKPSNNKVKTWNSIEMKIPSQEINSKTHRNKTPGEDKEVETQQLTNIINPLKQSKKPTKAPMEMKI